MSQISSNGGAKVPALKQLALKSAVEVLSQNKSTAKRKRLTAQEKQDREKRLQERKEREKNLLKKPLTEIEIFRVSSDFCFLNVHDTCLTHYTIISMTKT